MNKEKRCWIFHAESVSLLMRVEPVMNFVVLAKAKGKLPPVDPIFYVARALADLTIKANYWNGFAPKTKQ